MLSVKERGKNMKCRDCLKELHLTKESHGDDFIELLAVSLAEKLCFRVEAVLEWVDKCKLNADYLAGLHRQIAKEGVTGPLSDKILVAVVNQKGVKI